MSSVVAKRPPNSFFRFSADRFTQPFWDAAGERRLVAPRCGLCGRFRMPPTPFCPHCQSQELDWVTLSGTGSVYSYTIVTRAIMPDMEASLPYVPAVIALEDAGGFRLISNVVETPLAAIAIDMPVRVVWDDIDGITVPRFTLA